MKKTIRFTFFSEVLTLRRLYSRSEQFKERDKQQKAIVVAAMEFC